MSKYTTEVRFICESRSGLNKNQSGNTVDKVISESWNKIFTTQCEVFDESYRQVICSKILKHYYLREICCETVGIWQLWLNTRFEEIMPYYNQLYKSALLEFDPFKDVEYNVQRDSTENRKNDSTRSGVSKTNTTQVKNDTETAKTQAESSTSASENASAESNTSTGKTDTATSKTTSVDLYSDTPQGALTGVETETYLTNARKKTEDTTGNVQSSGTETGHTSSDGSSETQTNGTETRNFESQSNLTGNASGETRETAAETGEVLGKILEKVSGKRGVDSYSKMLLDFRKTMVNIDAKVIEEFEDLFFGLW